MKSRSKVATAISILSWLVDQHAPSPALVMLSGVRPTNDERVEWLRRRRAEWLAIDTSRFEAAALTGARLLATRGCQPSLLRVTAKHTRAVAHPSYRLTDLGRCWCVSLLLSDDAEAVHDAMLLAAMERPAMRRALAAEVASAASSSLVLDEYLEQARELVPAADFKQDESAGWVALRLLGLGVEPAPGADSTSRALYFAERLAGDKTARCGA